MYSNKLYNTEQFSYCAVRGYEYVDTEILHTIVNFWFNSTCG